MTTSRVNRSRCAAAGLVLAVLAHSAAAFGDARPPQMREQHQKEIAGKSESERARLQRNFRTFRDLPPAEQERLRRLDRELKEDGRAGGNLRAIMDEYYNWLATLTPGQQQDLRPTNDPDHPEKNDATRREIRVRELLKEQQDQIDATGAGKGGGAPPRLSSKDLDTVLGVVEEAMREKHLLSSAELQELQNKKDLARHMYLWGLAFRPRVAGAAPGQPLPWMSKDVFESMIDGISNEKLAAHVKAGQNMDRWWRLVRLIYGGIRAEYEQLRPDQETLERFFVELNSTEQDEIMRLPSDQQPQQLTHMYMTKMSEKEPDRFPRPPQLPFWARGNRAGVRGGIRSGDQGQGSEPGGARRGGAGMRKSARDRQKNQETNQE
jgi:hypothetical protein